MGSRRTVVAHDTDGVFKTMKRVLAVLFATMLVGQVWAGGIKKMASMMSKVRCEVSQAILQADGNIEVNLRVTFPPNFFISTAIVEFVPVLKCNSKEWLFDNTISVQGESVQGNRDICSFRNGGTFSTKSSIRFKDEMRNSKLYVRAKIKAGNNEIICPDIEVVDGIAPTAPYTSVKYELKVLELREGNVEMEMDIILPKYFFYDETAKVDITPVLRYQFGTERAFASFTVHGLWTKYQNVFTTKSSMRFFEGMRNSELYVRAKIIAGGKEIVCPDVKVADTVIKSSSKPLALNYDYEIDELSEQGLIFAGRWYKTDDFPGFSVRVHKDSDKFFVFFSLYNEEQLGRKFLRVEGKDYASFEKNMAIVNEKFVKWAQTAKSDGVKNFTKTIPVDFGDNIVYCTSGGNWKTKLYAVFEVDEDGDCRLRLDDREIEDPNNYHHSPYLRIYSQKRFGEFCEVMKFDNVMKNYEIMKSKIDAKENAIKNRNAKFN